MAPEQAMGKKVDRRADIWSTGVLLYEMITASYPFNKTSSQSALRSLLKDEPRPVTELRPGAPGDLDWIIGKALAKKPEERYQHVDDLIVDLRGVLKKLPANSHVPRTSEGISDPDAPTVSLLDLPDPETAALPEPVKKSRWPVILAVVLALALIVAALFWLKS